jgi:hypothetical protein
MSDDISKKTVAILLVIAIVLSAIATWRMLDQKVEVKRVNTEGTAQVSIGIIGDQQQGESEVALATGKVTLEIT